MNDFSDYINGVISEFEVQNPDIKIKWIDVPFSEGEKRTLASVLPLRKKERSMKFPQTL